MTIKRNSIIIEINSLGKMFEIKRITTTRIITTYSRRQDIDKKIDLLKLNQLEKNLELTREILKDGIKIYG